MNLALRLIWLRITAGRRSPLGPRDISRLTMRPWLGDHGFTDHLNNGVYLTMMDVGRGDLWIRSGAWARMRAAGCAPVVASSTITYRKSIPRFHAFVLETRALGAHDRAVFYEQRFVIDGEIFARAIAKVRVVRPGDRVTAQQVAELLGPELATVPVEPWMLRWADDVALPATRAEAPSLWGP